jgi:hypothetical protein
MRSYWLKTNSEKLPQLYYSTSLFTDSSNAGTPALCISSFLGLDYGFLAISSFGSFKALRNSISLGEAILW